MKSLVHTLIAAACGLAFTAAQADNMSKASYDSAKDQIKAAAKSEREACDSLAGNTKDICVETAKGREKVALAHLEMQRTGAAKDQAKLVEARYEARYEVAKERCDDRAGNDKDICMQQAKAEHEKAKADAKANKEIREARADADEAKWKADYKVATERCDTLSGDAKNACQAAAKARFNQ